jgi:hypothetical protein
MRNGDNSYCCKYFIRITFVLPSSSVKTKTPLLQGTTKLEDGSLPDLEKGFLEKALKKSEIDCKGFLHRNLLVS